MFVIQVAVVAVALKVLFGWWWWTIGVGLMLAVKGFLEWLET